MTIIGNASFPFLYFTLAGQVKARYGTRSLRHRTKDPNQITLRCISFHFCFCLFVVFDDTHTQHKLSDFSKKREKGSVLYDRLKHKNKKINKANKRHKN